MLDDGGHAAAARSAWIPDGLFYQARALGAARAHRARGAPPHLRRPLRRRAPGVDPHHSGDPAWVRYNAQFYERRVAVPPPPPYSSPRPASDDPRSPWRDTSRRSSRSSRCCCCGSGSRRGRPWHSRRSRCRRSRTTRAIRSPTAGGSRRDRGLRLGHPRAPPRAALVILAWAAAVLLLALHARQRLVLVAGSRMASPHAEVEGLGMACSGTGVAAALSGPPALPDADARAPRDDAQRRAADPRRRGGRSSAAIPPQLRICCRPTAASSVTARGSRPPT